jgi:hypothetical protein
MVAKKYPGELKIHYIGGPEAVKTDDQVQALQRGMVDMVFTTNAYYVSVLPEVDALKLSDYTPNEERTSGAWSYMNELHEKKIGICYERETYFNFFKHLEGRMNLLFSKNIRLPILFLTVILLIAFPSQILNKSPEYRNNVEDISK